MCKCTRRTLICRRIREELGRNRGYENRGAFCKRKIEKDRKWVSIVQSNRCKACIESMSNRFPCPQSLQWLPLESQLPISSQIPHFPCSQPLPNPSPRFFQSVAIKAMNWLGWSTSYPFLRFCEGNKKVLHLLKGFVEPLFNPPYLKNEKKEESFNYWNE